PNWVLLPSVVALCWAGVYAFRMSRFDLVVAAAPGVIGFFMLRYKFQLVPVLFGTLIGPLVERHFRQGLTAANGDLTYFITQPVGEGLGIGVALVVVARPVMRWWVGRKQQADQTTAEVQKQAAI